MPITGFAWNKIARGSPGIFPSQSRAEISLVIAIQFSAAFGMMPLISTNSGNFDPSALRSEQ
jgi:hypothetical protein